MLIGRMERKQQNLCSTFFPIHTKMSKALRNVVDHTKNAQNDRL